MRDSEKMSELKNIIKQIEEIYGKLTTKDNDPEVESQLKSNLLNIFSSLLAITKVKKGEFSNSLEQKIENVKTHLLSWDPLDNWFKEVKDLVDGMFDLMTAAKSLNYDDIIFDKKHVSKEQLDKVLEELKSEINEIKLELAKIKQSNLKSAIIQQTDLTKPIVTRDIPIAKPVQIPKPVSVPKPIPKPAQPEISKPKPVPLEIPKPAQVPKPVPIDMPVEIPKPTPKPVPVEVPKTVSKPQSSKSKKQKQQASKEKLFGLFSQPAEPSSLVQKPISVQEPVSIPKPTTSGFKTISSPIAKPVSVPKMASGGFKVIGTSSSSAPTKPKPLATDQDKLYQELITLEGKKYSLERNLRDLKAIFESGALNESQYKSQYNEKLNELKDISSKIDKIREQLD